MIPSSSVELSLELVGIALSRWNRTLVNSGNTVLPWCRGLKESMPVQSCSFGLAYGVLGDVVVDGDLDDVSPVGLNGRPREGPIDKQHRFLISVRSKHSSADSEVI